MDYKVNSVLDTFKVLRKATNTLPKPMSVVVAHEYNKDPYLLLISCLLSLRAKDVKTLLVTRKLFSVVRTPKQMLALSEVELKRIIYSIGFYNQKSRMLRSISRELLERFDGKVPRNRQELLSIKGIGPKTASLVLAMAFDVPAICVDVHVHRLANMLGWVHTKTPRETEGALEKIFPKRYWVGVNHVLVKVGQNISIVVPKLPKQLQKKFLPLFPKRIKL